MLWSSLCLVLFYHAFAREVNLKCFNWPITGMLATSQQLFSGSVPVRRLCIRGDMCIGREVTSYTFNSSGRGRDLDVECPGENEIIKTMNLTVLDNHVPSVSIGCCTLKDEMIKTTLIDWPNRERGNIIVNCPRERAIQKMSILGKKRWFGNVKLQCVELTNTSVITKALPSTSRP